MANIRVETLAVQECLKGNIFPLFQILAERLQSSRFAVTICMSLARGKPVNITKRERIGVHVDAMLRRRPGEKKQICDEVAARFGLSARTRSRLSARTVENYYAHWLKTTKLVRHELNPIIEADE